MDFQFPHAWIELPNNIIFDGVLQQFYDKHGYYDTYKITKINEYTPVEAREFMLKTGRHDFWVLKNNLESCDV
ncbi:hypothetical protein SAMN05443253_11514 [Bacillus sp. OK048]|nr:hypothetical protein SAMN05443253_11514 [Bacillus sp. OK048]